MHAPQFKIKKRITMAVLPIKPNAGDRFFKFVGKMYVGEKLDDQKNPATLLESIDLVTGEHGIIIVSTIMQNDLNKHFPDDSYAGKCFCVTVTRNSAKKYNHVSLAEIEDPAAEPEAPASTPAVPEAPASTPAVPEAPASTPAVPEAPAVTPEASDVSSEAPAVTPEAARQGRRHR